MPRLSSSSGCFPVSLTVAAAHIDLYTAVWMKRYSSSLIPAAASALAWESRMSVTRPANFVRSEKSASFFSFIASKSASCCS